ncbi:MAG: hypothetical protein ABI778_03960 [Ignavibacteriota bacterium]
MPKQFSSSGYRMDGSRLIAEIGVPQEVSILVVGDTTLPKAIPPSSVVPLLNSAKFTYAFAAGTSIYLGNRTGYKLLTSMPSEKEFVQILTDNSGIYCLHSDGLIDVFDHTGKAIWRHSSLGISTAPAILSNNQLIVTAESGIGALDIHTGKDIWFYPSLVKGISTVYDDRSNLIITALSFNTSNASDSILSFSPSGEVRSRYRMPGMRIISNLCLCGNDKDRLAFGYIGMPNNPGEVRSLKVAIYSGLQAGKLLKTSDQSVSYLATNIASNGPVVLSSGFEQAGGSLESGIDAFAADDSTKLWERHFTRPVVTPVAISKKYAYFHLSFSTEAIVPAKSIFYTLELSSGKTLAEVPLKGIRNGTASGMPLPVDKEEIILSDNTKPALYFLKP